MEYELYMQELFNEVKSIFNRNCSIPNDQMDDETVITCVNSMLNTFKLEKENFSKVQRAIFIMRIVNCMVKNCSIFCHAHVNFLESMMDRVHNIFYEESMHSIDLEYLRSRFPFAWRTYERRLNLNDDSNT